MARFTAWLLVVALAGSAVMAAFEPEARDGLPTVFWCYACIAIVAVRFRQPELAHIRPMFYTLALALAGLSISTRVGLSIDDVVVASLLAGAGFLAITPGLLASRVARLLED